MHRAMTLLVVAALLVVGCTSATPGPDPSPSTGAATTPPVTPPSTPSPGRVAVVVAPEPALAAAAAEIGSRGVATRMPDDAELRVVTADDASFVPDLATFLATEGYDLVCVLGAGAEAAVREVAPSSPSTRFCAAPARPADDLPSNVLPIDLRVEQVGYVAGVALATDGAAGPVGLVTSRTTWAPSRIRAGLAAGLQAAGVASPDVRVVGPLADDEAAEEQVAVLLEAGSDGVLSLTGALDAVVRDLLLATPVVEPPAPSPTATDRSSPSPSPSPTATEDRTAGLVAGPEGRPAEDGAELPELLLAVLELHLEEAVALAVDRHLDEWSTEPASVGLADGAFRVDVGAGERGGAVATAVGEAIAGIRDGSIEIPTG